MMVEPHGYPALGPADEAQRQWTWSLADGQLRTTNENDRIDCGGAIQEALPQLRLCDNSRGGGPVPKRTTPAKLILHVVN